MKQQINRKHYRQAQCMTLNVDFVKTFEEFSLYTSALYHAMEWATKVTKQPASPRSKPRYPVPRLKRQTAENN